MREFFTRSIFPVLFLAIVFISPTAGAEPQKVDCGTTPKEGIQDLGFEIVWEQSAESEDYLLSYLVDAAIDPSGNICAVDFLQKNMTVFDKEGNWLRTIGREGEGPGELRDARQVFFDGNRYGILQAYPAAIVWLNRDGSPAGKAPINETDPEKQIFYSAAHAVQSGPQIYVWLNQTIYTDEGGEMESWITILGPGGNPGPALYTPPDGVDPRVDDGIDESKVYDIWLRRWTGDGQGGVWVAPERDRYLLQHWNADGELALEISRDYELVTRNENGKDRIVTWFKRRGWNEDQIHVGETAPIVRGLRLGDTGDLWVGLEQSGKDPDSDLVGVYDIISPTGEYLRQIRMHCGDEVDSRVMLNDETSLILATDSEFDEAVISFQRTVDLEAGGRP